MTAPMPGGAPLVTMCGAPGSGKSTWVADRFDPGVRFGLDQFRRILSGDDLAQDSSEAAATMLATVLGYRLNRGLLCVIDATNASWERRETLRYLAIGAGRPTVAVVMQTPLEVCLQRQRARNTAPYPEANHLPVPDDVVRRMWHQLNDDPPLPDEYDLIAYVSPDGSQTVAIPPQRAGRDNSWAQHLLEQDRWSSEIRLLSGAPVQLPWVSAINEHLARHG